MLNDFKRYFPVFTTPSGKTQTEYFNEIIDKQAKIKYKVLTQEIKDRIEYEKNVFIKCDYVNCVLVISEMAKFLRQNGAVFKSFGPQCGSVVNYLLGITEYDPIEYGFLFERYIVENTDNKYPFYYLYADKRNIRKIVKLIKNKFGEYSIFKTKPSLYDNSGYVFGVDLKDVDMFDKDKKKCLLTGSQAENKGLFVLNIYYDKLLEMLSYCKQFINADFSFDINSCNDLKTWQYLSSGEFINPETITCQKADLRQKIDRLDLNCLEDLSAYISIGGFSEKSWIEDCTDSFSKYKSLIKQEKLIYQEDCMAIIHKMTGWSLSECNLARKSICKRHVTEKMQGDFIKDCAKNGYIEGFSREILKELKDKTLYIKTKTWTKFRAFCLYQLAYISLYYPKEYETVLENYKKQ